MDSEVERDEVVIQLQARIADLEKQLHGSGLIREKIDKMSSEVVDTNPYRSVVYGSVRSCLYTIRPVQSSNGAAENGHCGRL